MHAGVERDMEKQRIKQERQADFELQKRLEQEYRKSQHVSDGRIGIDGRSRGQETWYFRYMRTKNDKFPNVTFTPLWAETKFHHTKSAKVSSELDCVSHVELMEGR